MMSDLLATSLAWTALGIAGLLIVILVLGDRLRWLGKPRPRRCSRCWYDMSGTESLTCSECGKTVKRERGMRRWRRRRWLVWPVLLLVLASYPLFSIKELRREGWWYIVPDVALVHLSPMEEPPNTRAFWDRAGLYRGRPGLFITRAAPVGLGKSARDATLRRLLNGQLNDDHQRLALARYFDANPETLLALVGTRSTWVAGEGIHVLPPDWSPLVQSVRLDGTEPLDPEDDRTRVDETLAVGQAPDSDSVDLIVTVGLSPRVTHETRLTLNIVADARDALLPRTGDGPDQCVMESIAPVLWTDPTLSRYPHEDHPLSVEFTVGDADFWCNAAAGACGLGVALELRRDGELAATGSYLHPTGVGPTSGRWKETTSLDWVIEPMPVTRHTGNWQLVVRGDPRIVLPELRWDEYWAGEFTVDLNEE